MITKLQMPEEALDDGERKFLNVIQEHGWFNTRVFDHKGKEPDFSYSTGFSLNLGFPEIIVFSLPSDVSHSVFWDIWRDVKDGNAPPIGVRTSNVFAGTDAILLPVAKSSFAEHLGWSRWFYGGDDFDCLQLIWPDRQGKFPWEDGHASEFANSQPDLTGEGWKSHPA